jgi:4-carboxymuconolactone decarboxylase
MTQPRFPRLTPEVMTPEQREVADEIAAGPRGEVRGPFIALIHNPELARRVQKLGEYLRWEGKLPSYLKELAVLVTARRWTCQHEWVMHSKLALEAGLAVEVVEAIKQGEEPAGMSQDEKAVYAFCCEAHASGRVGDEAFLAIENRLRIKDRSYVGPRRLPSGGFSTVKRRRPEDEPRDPWNRR